MVYRGFHAGAIDGPLAIPVDPNVAYRTTLYVRQDTVAGSWSGYANGSRHRQTVGLAFLDADGLAILPVHHMRFRRAGVDSRTTLAAPLAPGDRQILVADARGWNDGAMVPPQCGVIIFGHRDAAGQRHDHYSRLVETNLFLPQGVDRAAGRIALGRVFPARMANPDRADGVWPAGTAIANCSTGPALRETIVASLTPARDDVWYRCGNVIGGVDRSGLDAAANFPPGTRAVRPVWLANATNHASPSGGYPSTGPDHAVRFAGLSIRPEPLAAMARDAAGAVAIKVPRADFGSGALSLVPAAATVEEA